MNKLDKILIENDKEIKKIIFSNEKIICDFEYEKNLETIMSDKNVLDKLGITFEQISLFFRKIMYHFDYQYSNTMISPQIIKILNPILIKITECQYYDNNYNFGTFIRVNTKDIFDEITVINLLWLPECYKKKDKKCEKCENYVNLKNVWIFINKITSKFLHIGEKQYYQIMKYNFFQTNKSINRIEPSNVVEFFKIKKDLDYSTELELVNKKWGNGYLIEGGHKSDHINTIFSFNLKNYNLFDENKITHIFRDGIDVYYNSSKICLIINDTTYKNWLFIPFYVNKEYVPLQSFFEKHNYVCNHSNNTKSLENCYRNIKTKKILLISGGNKNTKCNKCNTNNFVGKIIFKMKTKHKISQNEKNKKWFHD